MYNSTKWSSLKSSIILLAITFSLDHIRKAVPPVTTGNLKLQGGHGKLTTTVFAAVQYSVFLFSYLIQYDPF